MREGKLKLLLVPVALDDFGKRATNNEGELHVVLLSNRFKGLPLAWSKRDGKSIFCHRPVSLSSRHGCPQHQIASMCINYHQYDVSGLDSSIRRRLAQACQRIGNSIDTRTRSH